MHRAHASLAKAFPCGILASAFAFCSGLEAAPQNAASPSPGEPAYRNRPLVSDVYTADPAAHVFGGRVYLYTSHDIPGVTDPTDGNHYAMRDYHCFSKEEIGGNVTPHGVILKLEDVPWASRQLWALDAAESDGRYYLYFCARDKEQIFRVGVASSDRPAGPFKAEAKPLEGAYSIDPTAFRDDDGAFHLYFGGLSGGQLERWKDGKYNPDGAIPEGGQPAVQPRIARISPDMTSLAEPAREIEILDPDGKPLVAGDEERRFFEGPWVHKYNGEYYLSYSTGSTHRIAYATGKSPYGPFAFRGFILEPVKGWTTHHCIIRYQDKWWLFYHDAQLSGESNLRNVKVTELKHRSDGSIETIDPFIR